MSLFKELYELWKRDNSLTTAINDSHRMLEHASKMFQASVKSLRKTDDGDIDIDVYKSDVIINEYIRDARGKVLKHLAITGGLNIIPGLVLTSVVIDIERIGDYTKNIMDMAIDHPRKLEGGKFEEDFQKIEKVVTDTFVALVPILATSDKGAAKTLIDSNYWVLKKCDEIVRSFITDENKSISHRDAASRALYARYLKRIEAHLLNIASSVVNPFENIGFRKDDEDDA